MDEVRIMRVVVASPGDVQSERDALPDVVEEMNKGIAAEKGLRLELFRWETDAYPGFHPEGAQGLIDPVLRIENCHVLIGIFWKRFGTPTGDAQSGTEHEFRNAYEAWKQNGRPPDHDVLQPGARFPADAGGDRPMAEGPGVPPEFSRGGPLVAV